MNNKSENQEWKIDWDKREFFEDGWENELAKRIISGYIRSSIQKAIEGERERLSTELEKQVEFFDPKEKAIPYVKFSEIIKIIKGKEK